MNYEDCKKYINNITNIVNKNKQIDGDAFAIVAISISNNSGHVKFGIGDKNNFIVEFDDPYMIIKQLSYNNLEQLEGFTIVDTFYISTIDVSFF